MSHSKWPWPTYEADCIQVNSRGEKPMSDDRVKTMLRIPKSLHERLTQAAEERDVSANWLACRALDDFLTHLIPADELRLTRDER